MSLNSLRSIANPCGLVSGLVGTLVPAGPRLRGTCVEKRGIGGRATKSKTKGGWRHAPCLLGPKNSSKSQNRKKGKKQNRIGNKMNQKHIQKRKINSTLMLIPITLTATAFLNSGCQTVGAKQNRQMIHVLSEQETLIENVLNERNQDDVKTQVGESKVLTKAELHLAAALNALKQSNKALQEAMKNGQN